MLGKMSDRIVIASSLVALGIGLVSCAGAETPEQCVERFSKQFPSDRFFDSGSWRSTLIYRLPDDYKIPELQSGGAHNGFKDGPKFMIAQGPEQAAFDNFRKEDVPAKGAYLALNGKTFFRTNGPVGTMKDAAAAGCTDGPKGSQLIRIDWAAEPRQTTT
jgi:hypothetical protein